MGNAETKTPIQVANLLSYVFLSSSINKDALTKLGDFYPQIESRFLAKEWFSLQAFLLIMSISNHFGDRPEGLEIAKRVKNSLIEGYTEAGIFETEAIGSDLLKNRFNEYGAKSPGDSNPLLNISILFLKNINLQDALILVNTGEHIGRTLQTNAKLLKDTLI